MSPKGELNDAQFHGKAAQAALSPAGAPDRRALALDDLQIDAALRLLAAEVHAQLDLVRTR